MAEIISALDSDIPNALKTHSAVVLLSFGAGKTSDSIMMKTVLFKNVYHYGYDVCIFLLQRVDFRRLWIRLIFYAYFFPISVRKLIFNHLCTKFFFWSFFRTQHKVGSFRLPTHSRDAHRNFFL